MDALTLSGRLTIEDELQAARDEVAALKVQNVALEAKVKKLQKTGSQLRAENRTLKDSLGRVKNSRDFWKEAAKLKRQNPL